MKSVEPARINRFSLLLAFLPFLLAFISAGCSQSGSSGGNNVNGNNKVPAPVVSTLTNATEKFKEAEINYSIAEDELLKAKNATTDEGEKAKFTEQLQEVNSLKFINMASLHDAHAFLENVTTEVVANCSPDKDFPTSRTRFTCKKDETITIEFKATGTDALINFNLVGDIQTGTVSNGKLPVKISKNRVVALELHFQNITGISKYEVTVTDSQGKQFSLPLNGAVIFEQPSDGDGVFAKYFFKIAS